MIADIHDAMGRITRLVSLSGNMRGSKGSWQAQTARGQGSQNHMEIFHLERLGKVLERLMARQDFKISKLDIGILGKKTNSVVSENKMCEGCQAVKKTEIDDRIAGKKIALDFNVCFLKE